MLIIIIIAIIIIIIIIAIVTMPMMTIIIIITSITMLTPAQEQWMEMKLLWCSTAQATTYARSSPKPQTPNPKPQTPNPKPQTPNRNSLAGHHPPCADSISQKFPTRPRRRRSSPNPKPQTPKPKTLAGGSESLTFPVHQADLMMTDANVNKMRLNNTEPRTPNPKP